MQQFYHIIREIERDRISEKNRTKRRGGTVKIKQTRQ